MNDAVQRMLDQYDCRTQDDYRAALREILQQMALLGLWRSKFFEHAAFRQNARGVVPEVEEPGQGARLV